MANVLNIYDPENKELVLGHFMFFNKTYQEAAAIAVKKKAQVVYGINPADLCINQRKEMNV